ncbi:uncharacterized protein Eint_060720 [Encephalitozoon intestinalis ATCC 50506]|uniref:Uncharacterized protein n=1 Tax=Encephalitozoon intestinalis (strain ATCC 50506) TaxID=876142 RepID=E0S7K1_ENCIT|nr:uncharacterized protein Eint_060720 [Encephalitozoon intestinalis ATCC 50506]ADM11680.1 hypothetical protein Eint_060720 [Encephalitozoon intestinalis ATCC 50506]UTX45417.1 hypothetical protein GPK93_06g09700 [Encephalitozoon intestinalis]
MQENKTSEELKKRHIPLDFILSIINFFVAAVQLGYGKFKGDQSKDSGFSKYSKFITAIVLLIPIFKIFYQLSRFRRECGVKKMNRIKILCMVAYLLVLSAAIVLLFKDSPSFSLETQGMMVAQASLLGMVISSLLINYKNLQKGNYIDYFIILASLAFAARLVALFPPFKVYGIVVAISEWASIAIALVLPVLQSLLYPEIISLPISSEDFAMLNALNAAILILGAGIVASPYIQNWYSKFRKDGNGTQKIPAK